MITSSLSRRSGREMRQRGAVLFLVGAVLAGCSGPGTTEDVAPTESQVSAFERALNSVDLAVSLEGPATAEPGGEIEVVATARNNDNSGAGGTAISFELGGLTLVAVPIGCEQSGGSLSCVVPQSEDPTMVGVLDPHGDEASVSLRLLVSDAGTAELTATVTSHLNDLGNDPDPSNNIAVLALVVERASGSGSTSSVETPTTSIVASSVPNSN